MATAAETESAVNKTKTNTMANILIADEPTTALDVTIQAQILDLLRDLQKKMGMSIMLITHDLGVVAEMADEVVVMYAGKVAERAPVNEIFASPKHPYTQGLLNSIPVLNKDPTGKVKKKRLEPIPGIVPSLLDLPRGWHPDAARRWPRRPQLCLCRR